MYQYLIGQVVLFMQRANSEPRWHVKSRQTCRQKQRATTIERTPTLAATHRLQSSRVCAYRSVLLLLRSAGVSAVESHRSMERAARRIASSAAAVVRVRSDEPSIDPRSSSNLVVHHAACSRCFDRTPHAGTLHSLPSLSPCQCCGKPA